MGFEYDGDAISEQEWNQAEDEDWERKQDEDDEEDYCGDEEVIQEVLGNDVRFTEVEIDEPINDTANELELYKGYVQAEVANDNDFDTFSEWKEKNQRILN